MTSLLALMLAGATPAVANNSASAALAAPNCPRTTSMHAFDRSKPLKPQKLGELPAANAYKAVYRLIGGCEVPMVVKYGVGGR
jgi:hypothetical protein